MTRPFIVLALPRSRTAWLAHFLTAGGQFLIGHDITVECREVREFLDSFENGLVGTVETGAVLAWRLLRHEMPKARIVTLHRPLSEVMDSFARFGITPDRAELEAREAMLEAARRAPGVDSLTFDDLDDPECRRWLFETLLEVPLEDEWDRRLAGLNIQIDMLARSKTLWANKAALDGLRAEVIEATRRLEGGMEWMI